MNPSRADYTHVHDRLALIDYPLLNAAMQPIPLLVWCQLFSATSSTAVASGPSCHTVEHDTRASDKLVGCRLRSRADRKPCRTSATVCVSRAGRWRVPLRGYMLQLNVAAVQRSRRAAETLLRGGSPHIVHRTLCSSLPRLLSPLIYTTGQSNATCPSTTAICPSTTGQNGHPSHAQRTLFPIDSWVSCLSGH